MYTGQGFSKTLFPDNQPHISLNPSILSQDSVNITASLRNAVNVLELMEISETLQRHGVRVERLYIPYLMGARSDRPFGVSDSIDLNVIAKLINSIGAERVDILHPHNMLPLQLINNSVAITNDKLLREVRSDWRENYIDPPEILIVPDKGARESAFDTKVKLGAQDIVFCDKERTDEGIMITLDAEACRDKTCVIVDDLCDAGGTFLSIADKIEPRLLMLIVTHSIMPNGTRKLIEKFARIYTTNSYNAPSSSRITSFNVVS